MFELNGVKHHPAIEEIVDVLCNKTSNSDRGFFRVEVAYFMAKLAAAQRATITTKDRGELPINQYAIALGVSGLGKGYSINIMENEILSGFRQKFMDETFDIISQQSLADLATDRSIKNNTDYTDEEEKLHKEFDSYGSYPFTFDSGTVPAVKQLRSKLLLSKIGSINVSIDEIGANLINNTELLNVFLELYDQGLVKNKLTKNTAENKRYKEIEGKTPANLLLFGTPSKLFDGGQTEDAFYSFLEMGYARRCLFAIGYPDRKAFHTKTAAEIYHQSISPTNNAATLKWHKTFSDLGSPMKYGWNVQVPDDVAIKLIEYKIACEKLADTYAEHEDIKKAELSHRYFKALKLAGTYAFVNGSSILTEEELYQAILLVEESGKAFESILTREQSYIKLAKYIATTNTELTHADLYEALPFYSRGQTARNEMMSLATAWGYKQHILIKKTFLDGIEFFRGETLKKTELDKILISYSDNWAYNYEPEEAPFDQLHQLTQENGLQWANHRFLKGHRTEENALVGFNIVVVDVDGTATLEMAHEVLKDFVFMTYTTKRHTDSENRFRLIIPINYVLELDSEDYKEFMNNILEWLPFPVDEATQQRSRSWACYNGTYHYNLKGELLDALKFIPKTSKNEEYQRQMQSISSMDNLERWFAQKMVSGNRNNQMIKYALALVDAGHGFFEVDSLVKSFNKKLAHPLPENEIDETIMRTVAKKVTV